MKIESIHAIQIFDSRGLPTVQAEVRLDDGSVGRGFSPSGASTGAYEAHERRDGGNAFGGKGVSGAVNAINMELLPALKGLCAGNQSAVDARMLEVDGTPNKSRIGANAILAVSMANAEACLLYTSRWPRPFHRCRCPRPWAMPRCATGSWRTCPWPRGL